MGTMEVSIDFMFLTMDQIKEMAIRDRIKKFDGDKMKAAESLQIHFHTIENVLKAAEQPKINTVIRQEQAEENKKRGQEGWRRDPATGLNVPAPISAMPGVENIVAPLVEAEQKRIAAALKEGQGRVTSILGGTPVQSPKKGKTDGKPKSSKSSPAKAGKAS